MTSCGYAVPTVSQEAHEDHKLEASSREIERTGKLSNPPCKCFQDRHLLEKWLANRVNKNALNDYMVTFNTRSLDGLPGLRAARRWKGEWLWVEDARSWMTKKFGYPEAILLGIVIGIFLVMLAPLLRAALLVTTERMKVPRATIVEWMRMLCYKLYLIWRILSLQAHSVWEQIGQRRTVQFRSPVTS